MAASVLQSNSGVQNTAVTSKSVGLSVAATAGSYIVLFYGGDSYISTIPNGFTAPPGAAQEQYLGHYIWYKVATGGEQNFTITLNASASFTWAVMEISGVSDIEGSAGHSDVSFANNYATASITPTSGPAFMVASIAGSMDSAAMTTMSGWTNSYTELFDLHTTISSGTRDSMGIATLAYTANGSTATSTAITWDGNPSVQSHSGIILAFNAGPADVTPPSVPTSVHLTARTNDSLSLAWTASTDNTSVTGYNVYLNGSSTVAGTSTTNSLTIYGLTDNMAYQVTVKAFDKKGNTSGASTAFTANTLEKLGKYLWTGSAKQPTGSRIKAAASGLAQLTRVPWDGGPSYYSNFPQAAAGGIMTNSNFFPLLVDYESISSQADIDNDKSYGVNGYYRLTSGSSLSLVRSNGMIAFPGVDIIETPGNETVGYNIDDEVDMWANPGWNTWNGKYPGDNPGPTANSGYDAMYQLISALPNDGRMRHMNYGKGVAMWESAAESAVFTNGGSNGNRSFALDVVSDDLYFYSDPNIAAEAQNYFGLAPGSVRRSANYGNLITKRIISQQQSAGIFHPVYGFIETASQGANVPQASLTDDMIEGAVWNMICNEARGIIYFVHDFVYSQSQHTLRENVAGHKPRVASLNSRITALAPVLNTQSYAWKFNNSLITMMKVSGGYAYIFAMSVLQDTHDTTPRVFQLPEAITGKTITVVNESRTLPVTAGGFKDSFAAEFTCHIYKIAL